MDIQVLGKTTLFRGMQQDEINIALQQLQAEEKHYQKGETILPAGKVTQKMGLVLHGSVNIENNDLWGNRTILSHIGEGQFFAEAYALSEQEPMMVDVTANESCRILFLHIGYIHEQHTPMEPWAMKLILNLLAISTHKSLTLSARSFHTAPKTIRGRVMSYLNSISLQTRSREFDIPFDRQQLADYLNVERSALSKELSKMQQDGMIAVKKNHFVLQTDFQLF